MHISSRSSTPVQKREGIAGNLFEIGVHHGKTAIFFGRAAGSAELLGVCDVFDQQELNVDRSGEGSRGLFTDNMRRLAGISEDRLRVFAMRSERLTTSETTSTCRFFHIDGGHRPEDVRSDLETAVTALLPDGIIAVDDVFNPNWPGVGEGFYQFLNKRPGDLVPILIGGNKVLLSRPAAAERYERHLPAPGAWDELIGTSAYRFDAKEWLGRRVMTATRREWVDLNPRVAALSHLGRTSWKGRLRKLLR